MNDNALTVAGAGQVEQNGTEVTSLVRLAVDKGVAVEVLERLVALQERVTDRNARSAFIAALAGFQQDCPRILKTRENTQFTVTRAGTQVAAKYAPLEEIVRVAQPVAASHGLVWTWDTRVDEKLMHVTCRVLHSTGHAETATVSLPYESKAGASPQQKYAISQSYGMRYSLIAALGITTADEDTDGAGDAAGECISDSQAADLEALMDEVGVNHERFLRWLNVETVADIPARDYKRAVAALEEKRSR